MSDSFLHNHQSALDNQREDDAIQYLQDCGVYPDPDDKFFLWRLMMNCKQVDIGDKCIECMRSTVFGTGLFVNRLPADNDKYIGYLLSRTVIFYE